MYVYKNAVDNVFQLTSRKKRGGELSISQAIPARFLSPPDRPPTNRLPISTIH